MGRITKTGVLLVLTMLVMADHSSVARGENPSVTIEAFLKDYEQAFVTGNPYLLQRYDPSWDVFRQLLHTQWFDQVEQTRVSLEDVQVTTTNRDAGRYTISLVKIQEDIQHNGVFTRGLAGVRIDVESTPDGLQVRNHRTFPPRVAVEGYLSSDPRSWGEEHSLAERYLYRGLEYLRDGDLKGAEDQISSALAMVRDGKIPKFLLGPAYFMATCYYYSAMLHVKRGAFPVASEQLDEALILHPDFPAALNLRAELYFSEAENEQALRRWRKSVELFPQQSATQEIIALLTSAAESKSKRIRTLLLSLVNLPPSQAIQALAPEVKNKPRSKILVPLLTKAYMASDDPEKAMEVLENSRLINKHAEVTYLAARIQLKLQSPDKALELFERTWELEAGYNDTLVFLVYLHAAQGQFRAALARLGDASFLEWGGALHAQKGKYNLLAGRFLDAVTELELATQSKLPSRIRAEVAYLLQRISRQRR